ncbi:hypothetical protein GCM10011512_28860 [Tersicoccus solisilvae]|uniref:DUF1772 domain-containing protein n=1 Tax=Tersicoccus solisilvae TaxID=1882339 RepID=A0ABQ1PP21_9MICC|nr:anthrone oxygenase family protein [Tersicoccus solisilvae]GGD00251.1 hypothetical protein GCM10011512_28860 [Tersicoccus solisilvae]
MTAVHVVQLVLVGLLAGEEFIVRWGLHPALATLPEDAHVRTRIALVHRLKVVVPALMVPAVVATVAVLVVAGPAPGLGWRIAGAMALLVFVLASFLGTVPINIGVDAWDPAAPPPDWRDVVLRWARLDVLRSAAAIAAFILFAIASG